MGLFSRKNKDKGSKTQRSAGITVANVKQLTAEAAQITFNVPSELKENYKFTAGQYLNLHCEVDGSVKMRSYSICSAPNEELSVAVKAIQGGQVSNYLVSVLKAGETMEVDFPQGNFKLASGNNHVVFAAGSGITPILSMAKSIEGTDSKMELFYLNSSPETAFFSDELRNLKNTTTHFYYSKAVVDGAGSGRFDKQKVSEIIKDQLALLRADHFYLCGPEQMIVNVKEVLGVFGIKQNQIHFELFTTPVLMKQEVAAAAEGTFVGVSKVSAFLDGEKVEVEVKTDGKTILDALDNAGMDVPYSCKGGVCCTCKAKIIEGTVKMNINYALTDEEVNQGYILTCQSHPTSAIVKIDFDA